MAWRVELTPAARRDLAAADRPDQRRIAQALDLLAADPRPPGARPLSGGAGALRVRVGDWRIVYVVRDREILVLVIAIAHRSAVYTSWRRRIRGR